MKKNYILWISICLLMLAGCSSSDDEITINDENILGYWESINESIWGTGGLVFTSDGEIKIWADNDSGPRTYSEEHWGYFWFDDEGTLKIQKRPKDSDPYPDESYYKVTSLTKDRLIIRIFGGFAGTPYEKGTDVVFKKIDKPNK